MVRKEPLPALEMCSGEWLLVLENAQLPGDQRLNATSDLRNLSVVFFQGRHLVCFWALDLTCMACWMCTEGQVV